MPQQLCKVCGQWVNRGNSFWQKHLLGDQHQAQLNLQSRQNRAEKLDIFITGFRGQKVNLQVLKSLFCQFGTITDGHMSSNKSFAFLQFDTVEAAAKAIKCPVYLNDARLVVRPRTFRNQNKQTRKQQEQAAELSGVAAANIKIEAEGTYEEQAQKLMSLLGMSLSPVSPELDDRLNHVCQDVRRTLAFLFSACQTFIFGSRKTGLAKENSDVDIFVDLSNCEHLKTLKQRELQKGTYDPHSFHQTVFKVCLRMFYQSRLFTNVSGIGKARIPVIKCVHANTEIQCDVTFKNSLSVWNSKLIKYYIELDERVKLLVVILRYWVSVCNELLSPYAISMMLFSYLHQLSEPVVPSVKQLLSADTKQICVDGWHCSFEPIQFHSNNTQSVRELLIGFFTYVGTFDFGVDIMACLDATVVPKWMFLTAHTLPESQERLKNAMLEDQQELPVTSPLCIQDPVELSHNTTRGVGSKQLTTLQEKCLAAAEYCSNNPQSLDGLFHIPATTENLPHANYVIKIGLSNFFPSIEEILEAGGNVREIWYTKVISVIEDIFQLIFYFKINKSENASPTTNKVATSSDECITWNLNTKFCLWCSRKKGIDQLNLPSSLSTIDREIKISQHLIKKYYNMPEEASTNISIGISLKYQSPPTCVLMTIERKQINNESMHGLLLYLNRNLNHLIAKGLSETYSKEFHDADKDMELGRTCDLNAVSELEPKSVAANPPSSDLIKESIAANPPSSDPIKEPIAANPPSSDPIKEPIAANSSSSEPIKESIAANPSSSDPIKESIAANPSSSEPIKESIAANSSPSDPVTMQFDLNEGSNKRKYCSSESSTDSSQLKQFPPPGYVLVETYVYKPSSRRTNSQSSQSIKEDSVMMRENLTSTSTDEGSANMLDIAKNNSNIQNTNGVSTLQEDKILNSHEGGYQTKKKKKSRFRPNKKKKNINVPATSPEISNAQHMLLAALSTESSKDD